MIFKPFYKPKDLKISPLILEGGREEYYFETNFEFKGDVAEFSDFNDSV